MKKYYELKNISLGKKNTEQSKVVCCMETPVYHSAHKFNHNKCNKQELFLDQLLKQEYASDCLRHPSQLIA